jgi:hypothetical protein
MAIDDRLEPHQEKAAALELMKEIKSRESHAETEAQQEETERLRLRLKWLSRRRS